ncbi:MAG: hypothetical protein COU10_03170 [Candidatus Harrisonbacteria bacterium CG10_big_fil_rev_8_21_14_0_10_45_28]|uniref:General secretion pathway GspH domain-containing protein n=1 Tax=Candidatus Harrisonbacteria bacterium CG10_big_fil_rev_8_21_14_0_10_45_28 TaxID=1974586 RepID=A0A2H0UMR7_9BACT|nr:MAG: hypothetical protein COU10_03170 [Candidatus Harrisonbacteria bacterium CG10_big_fil_rev_8_21_14_0_10_45_28]
MSFKKLSNNKGFTFIELLIALTIGIILISLASLSLRNFYSEQAINNETAIIAAMLRAAQEKSISQEYGTRWGVYFKNSVAPAIDYYYFISFDDALVVAYTNDPNNFTIPPDKILEQKRLPSSIDFTTPAEGSGLAIIFGKITGKPINGTGGLVLTADNATKTIVIDSAGKIEF